MVISKDVMCRQVGDEMVMLDLSTGTYFGLDPIGARIWQLLTEGQDLEGVVTTLLGQYDVGEDVLRHDAEALIKDLVARGLLQVVSRSL